MDYRCVSYETLAAPASAAINSPDLRSQCRHHEHWRSLQFWAWIDRARRRSWNVPKMIGRYDHLAHEISLQSPF
jgi:hypothetical protein